MTQPDLSSSPASRTPPEIWAAARADYVSGISAPVVAERYGLSERNLRRRASAEGWRREDMEPIVMDPPPAWDRPPRDRDDILAENPELEEVTAAGENARFSLLFSPEPHDLRRFAFRRAAEAAAMDAPQQAVVWMRLAQLADRCGDRIDRDARIFKDVDMLRAAYLRRLDQDIAPDRAEDCA